MTLKKQLTFSSRCFLCTSSGGQVPFSRVGDLSKNVNTCCSWSLIRPPLRLSSSWLLPWTMIEKLLKRSQQVVGTMCPNIPPMPRQQRGCSNIEMNPSMHGSITKMRREDFLSDRPSGSITTASWRGAANSSSFRQLNFPLGCRDLKLTKIKIGR